MYLTELCRDLDEIRVKNLGKLPLTVHIGDGSAVLSVKQGEGWNSSHVYISTYNRHSPIIPYKVFFILGFIVGLVIGILCFYFVLSLLS